MAQIPVLQRRSAMASAVTPSICRRPRPMARPAGGSRARRGDALRSHLVLCDQQVHFGALCARHAELFGGDFLSVRLSAVFGPWERPASVRDTPSLQYQILAAFARGEPAVMPEAGMRDWIYAPDAAEAVALLIEAERPRHRLYNISRGGLWPALQWGEAFAPHPGLQCRLAAPGEQTAIKLHGSYRAPLSVTRMADEFGWRAQLGCAESAAAMSAWLTQHKEWI